MEPIRDLIQFMVENKRYWLIPIALILVLLGGLLFLVHGTALAPFLYPIF